MFFDRINDPGETKNGLNNPDYADEIAKLRGYFEDFKAKIPDIGKLELNGKTWKHKID